MYGTASGAHTFVLKTFLLMTFLRIIVQRAFILRTMGLKTLDVLITVLKTIFIGFFSPYICHKVYCGPKVLKIFVLKVIVEKTVIIYISF
jgi:hypothetical protein